MTPNATRPTWPRRFPVWKLLGFVAALGAGWLGIRTTLHRMPVLEQFYIRSYVTGSLPRIWGRGKPNFVAVVFKGDRAASDEDFRRAGDASVRMVAVDRGVFHTWLKANIYDGMEPTRLFRWPLVGFSAVLIVVMIAGDAKDRKHNSEARNGRQLRGPKIVTRWEFNRRARRSKSDGLRLRLANRRNILEWMMPGETGKDIVIPRNLEASHFATLGSTGTGKSTIYRQTLYQVAGRDECAVIFDPHGEYVREFYDAARGDVILNPLDNRCPYWALEGEVASEAEATSMAMSLWPDEPNQQPFFKKHPRAIFAFIVDRHSAFNRPEDPASCENLGKWLSNPRVEISPRVAGTRHAVSTDADAKDQSQGLWATLGEVATPLMMMPRRSEYRQEWTVRDWSRYRQGWIFITSTPDTLEALRPLQSLWIDMIILKMQTQGKNGGLRRVWLMLDELRLLNRLPQLEMALTGQRKMDCPIFIGFQGISQLKDNYGPNQAETIIGQPYTRIVFRTSDDAAALHLSKAIGEVELERVSESKPAHLMGEMRRSYSAQRVISPLVLPSEIQSQDNLTGYIIQPGKTVKVRVSRTPAVARAEALIPRLLPRIDDEVDAEEVHPLERMAVAVDAETAAGAPRSAFEDN